MTDQPTWARTALAAYGAMQRWLAAPDGRALYHEAVPARGQPGNPYAYLWPCSRALQGTVCLAGVPPELLGSTSLGSQVQQRLAGLEHYWDRAARAPAYASYVLPPLGQGGDKYYDDNAWLALSWIQLFRMGLVPSLERAVQLFHFALTGLDPDPRHPRPGGLFWVEQGLGAGLDNHDRGAGASAAWAAIGYHLRELGVAVDLTIGDNLLVWVTTNLDRSGTGRGPFDNVVRLDGSIDTNLWSYTQGVVVGAYLQRYCVSHDGADLQRAEQAARQALSTFGDFLEHPPSFNAMCFQNLLRLCAFSRDAELRSDVRQRIEEYAEWTWNPATGARDPATDLFSFDDAGRPARAQQAARLQDQGALVQLYALLAWPPASYVHLT